MIHSSSIHLKSYNSFAIDAICDDFFEPSSITELIELTKQLPKHYYILGEGSNTLFIEEKTPPIIKPSLFGIKVVESDKHFLVTAAASENWHQLVDYCVKLNIGGLENLALIPGSVGAAPVQNIGAYGVELSDYCQQVKWFSFEDQQESVLTASKCGFGYRDSIFKRQLKNQGLITEVTFKLPKKWQPILTYAGLSELPLETNPQEVMNKVIAIRQAKLPDPKTLPNAGSFFKNPIVDKSILEQLISQYHTVPSYPVDETKVKLSAGWLIEQTGLKGFKAAGCGVHEKQALVLVNFASQSGHSIIELAKTVTSQVAKKFNIQLEPEVRMVSALKEVSFEEALTDG